jgi:hypothetical protein
VSGEFGSLSVDRRSPEMLRQSDPSPSTVAARGDRDGPGEWTEGLKPYGVTAWQLPGQGDRGAGCGEWYPDAVCETCGEPRFASRVCGARSCPDCWGVWAKESGVRATVRVQAYRYTQPNDWNRQVAHAIVSPPEGEVRTEREYWEGRSEAAEMARSKGWRGFAVIPHPYRVTEEGKERFRAEDPEYGIWVWLRNDVEGMSRYLKWSPHYHIVGATGADMEPAKDSDEWVYHFRRSVESFDGVRDADSHEDVYGLFRYLLSHTGFPAESTKQTTTWYGDLANSVFVEDATEGYQYEKPSKGVRDALERHIEGVAGVEVEEDEGDGGGSDDDDGTVGECPVEGCDGHLIDVFDIEAYLRQTDPPPEVRERMQVARDWRLGRVHPPPGLMKPQSEEQAHEAFEALL